MYTITGLNDYLKENYSKSTFTELAGTTKTWCFHLHGNRLLAAAVKLDSTYDFHPQPTAAPGEETQTIPKLQVKFMHPLETTGQVHKLLRTDPRVAALALEPIPQPGARHHVKNKTLFPLMHERAVVFATLLEGEVIRGLIAGFSRYEITINMKGGIPVVILRHALYDLRDKRGTCLLKSVQEQRKDWLKSPLVQQVNHS